MDILESIISWFFLFFSKIYKDIVSLSFDLNVIINALAIFGFFYFISKWFRAYIIRVFIVILALYVLRNVAYKEHILYSFDFYASLGLLVPQIETIEITYYMIRLRIIYLLDFIQNLISLISTPFVWLFIKLKDIYYFFNAIKDNKKSYNYNNYQNSYYKQENSKKENYQQKDYSNKKKYEEKKTSRWDSQNPYEILGINENASKAEIKKAYRKLSKIYHPDLTLTKKEEYTKIFQKINWAYNILK